MIDRRRATLDELGEELISRLNRFITPDLKFSYKVKNYEIVISLHDGSSGVTRDMSFRRVCEMLDDLDMAWTLAYAMLHKWASGKYLVPLEQVRSA